MLVHSDHSGHHGIAGQIHHLRAGRNACLCGSAHPGNFSAADHDCLIISGRGASAVNHFYVSECNHRGIRLDELAQWIAAALRVRWSNHRADREQNYSQDVNQSTHLKSPNSQQNRRERKTSSFSACRVDTS